MRDERFRLHDEDGIEARVGVELTRSSLEERLGGHVCGAGESIGRDKWVFGRLLLF